MNNTQSTDFLQRWNAIQYDLIPELREEVGCLTPKLEKLIHVLEWVRIEEFVEKTWFGVGRPPHDRGALANAFVAKVVLGLSTTVGLLERLQIDRALRRICGFPMWKRLPTEVTFSRAFAEFAQNRLVEREKNGDVPLLNKSGTSLISISRLVALPLLLDCHA